MSVIAQFIQYPDYLTYALYLNNQANYPYWNHSNLCLAWIVGTPSLLVDSTHQCSFINTSNSCTPHIPQNPCTTAINTSQCNSVELFSGSISLMSTSYLGLTSIVSINSTNTQIYPKAGNSISGRSILISYSSNATQQENTCSNIRLGYGTINNFTYAQDANGTFVMNFPQTSQGSIFHSSSLLLLLPLFILLLLVK
ncbi:hypothetical protein K501DRAFT_285275 [Backusella circina FSU 941]|nr:hypothetical protein K501DRAFT_285275 [Backusella circina FSU 941]